jgi:transposase
MEIEVLRKHGFSLRRIAAEVGCAVNPVRSPLAAGQQPKYERQKKRPSQLSLPMALPALAAATVGTTTL